MENNFEKISVFDKDKKKFSTFSKINLLFGYAKSGKTSALSKLSDIFSGKDKHHLVNGAQAMPNDFNIIYVNSTEGLSNHLKLNSKSLVRKLIEMNRFSADFENASKDVQVGLESAKNELQLFLSRILPGSTIKMANENNIMDLLLDNVTVEVNSNSDSDGKWNLFSVVDGLASEIQNQTIVLFDDFNKDFDEEMTISFFEKLRKSSAIFILTSRRSFPQSLIHEEDSVFAIRNDEMIQIPPIAKMARDQIIQGDAYATFEEYMLNAGYLQASSIPDAFVKKILNDERQNVLRILTSKEPVINCSPIEGKVTICPNSLEEEKYYRQIFELLGIK